VRAVRLDSPANHPTTHDPRDRPLMLMRPNAAERMRRWFLLEPQLFRQQFLPALADETGGELIVASRSGDLRAVFTKIVAAFKTRYILRYSPD
jgi:hypothetical protein